MKKSYLVYFTDSLYNLQGSGDIWERSSHFTTKNDQPVVEFNWKWYHHDSLLANITNICNRKTLAPIFHKGVFPGKGIIAYNFTQDSMIATDTVLHNAVIKQPGIFFNIPIVNWEQDLETYALLPIKNVGQKFDIAFFDPN